jgi:hypothetical protein
MPVRRTGGRATHCTRCGEILETEEVTGSRVRQSTTIGFALKSIEEVVSVAEGKRIYPRIRLCVPCGKRFRQFIGDDWSEL